MIKIDTRSSLLIFFVRTRPSMAKPAPYSGSRIASILFMLFHVQLFHHILSTKPVFDYSFHCHLFPIHRTTYTKARRIGTSIRGPTLDAKAWSLLGPNVATATAIASSKLLLAAVKLWVLESR